MLGRKYTTTPTNSKASLSTLASAILELERDVLAPPKFADFEGWQRHAKALLEAEESSLQRANAPAIQRAETLLHVLSRSRADAHLHIEYKADAKCGVRCAPVSYLPVVFSNDDACSGLDAAAAFAAPFVTENKPPPPCPFVSNFVARGAAAAPSSIGLGDALLEVNGTPVARYLELMRPHLLTSTAGRALVDLATSITIRRPDFGQAPELYGVGDTIELTLRSRATGHRYRATVRYAPGAALSAPAASWARPPPHAPPDGTIRDKSELLAKLFAIAAPGGAAARNYSRFAPLLTTPSFTLHAPIDRARRDVVLLSVRGFKRHLAIADDFDALGAKLRRDASLGWVRTASVVVDLTAARGGTHAYVMLAHLVRRAFVPTRAHVPVPPRGTLRGDLVRAELQRHASSRRLSEPTRAWYAREVLPRLLRGMGNGGGAFANGSLFVHPKELDGLRTDAARARLLEAGVVDPAGVVADGGGGALNACGAPLALLVGPLCRSQNDQLAAMVADNRLGVLVGRPTGASSNALDGELGIAALAARLPPSRTGDDDGAFARIAGWRDALPDAVQALKWPFTLSATVRPNGEALEANAVLPDRYVPLTADNYARYSDVLVETAVEALGLPELGRAGVERTCRW